jgi:thioredoxin 1
MIELNKENFEAEVINYFERPVFIDFWGDKCEKCQQLMPEVERLSDQYKDKIKFCTLNTSKNLKLAIGQKVLGLPTMAIYINGIKSHALTPDKITSANDIENMILSCC